MAKEKFLSEKECQIINRQYVKNLGQRFICFILDRRVKNMYFTDNYALSKYNNIVKNHITRKHQ